MKRRDVIKFTAAATTMLALGRPARADTNVTLIVGYPNRWSVRQGDTIAFHLSTSSGSGVFTAQVYRKGLSENTVLSVGSGTVGAELVPATADSTGCGWPVRYLLEIPVGWKSGVYASLFTINGVSTEILFIVTARFPGSTSKTLMSIVTTTSQAYNNWGGKSLYDFNSTDGRRETRVSFHRPITSFARFFDSYEYHFIRWLEKVGIDVEFCSSLDIHSGTIEIDNYQLFLSVGHDEYWSMEMRNLVEDFVARGGNAAFFGANTCWWQIRFDSNNDDQMICYKCEDAAETIPRDPIADPALKTCHWFTSPGPSRPENSLTGLSYRSGGFRDDVSNNFDFIVRDASSWVFAGTSVSNGAAFGSEDNIIGYETDAAEFTSSNGIPVSVTGADGTAHNFKILCTSNAAWVADPGWAFLGMFQNNGTVFNAGTVDWSSGLKSFVNDGAPANIVCKITQNVLTTLGAEKTSQQKATLHIYQYHAVQSNGDGWRFFLSASPFINSGWTYDGPSFRAYRTQQANTVPVYQYFAVQGNGDGIRFLLSTDPSIGSGWTLDGISFYAYASAHNDPTNGVTVPVYAYHVMQANGDGIRTFYSRNSNIGGGWILDGVIFHAFIPNL